MMETSSQMLFMNANDLRNAFRTMLKEWQEEQQKQAALQQDENGGKTITTEEVCKLFHINPCTLSHWIKRGLLNPIKIGSRNLFRQKEVNELLNAEAE